MVDGKRIGSDLWLNDLSKQSATCVTARLPDKVARLGSNDLDGPRADYRGSDNLVAGDRDDLAEVAAK